LCICNGQHNNVSGYLQVHLAFCLFNVLQATAITHVQSRLAIEIRI
jgi:hypothetical protein